MDTTEEGHTVHVRAVFCLYFYHLILQSKHKSYEAYTYSKEMAELDELSSTLASLKDKLDEITGNDATHHINFNGFLLHPQ